MRPKIGIYFLICFCFTFACSKTTTKKLTEEEQAYLSDVKATPLSFVLSSDENNLDESWKRAESWIKTHSSTSYEKKVSVHDSTIQTYLPQERIRLHGRQGFGWTGAEFGYFVKKTTNENNVGFTVGFNLTRSPWDYPKGFISDVDDNCHILAHYIMSGSYRENVVNQLPFNEKRHMKYLSKQYKR